MLGHTQAVPQGELLFAAAILVAEEQHLVRDQLLLDRGDLVLAGRRCKIQFRHFAPMPFGPGVTSIEGGVILARSASMTVLS